MRNIEGLRGLLGHFWIVVVSICMVLEAKFESRLLLERLLRGGVLLLFDLRFKSWRCSGRNLWVIIVSLLVEREA